VVYREALQLTAIPFADRDADKREVDPPAQTSPGNALDRHGESR